MKFFLKIYKQILNSKKDNLDNENSYSNLINDNQNWINYIILTFISIFSSLFIFSILTKIDEVVSARGEIQTVGSERPIKSPLNGEIEKIFVEEGDSVNKNQILISIKAFEYKNSLELLKKNESLLKNKLKLQLDLVKKLDLAYKKGIITFQELNDVLIKKNQILLDINENKYKILETNELINKTKIVSPENGKVFNIIPSSPGYVTSYNENLLFIVPQKYIEAKLFIANSDIGFVKVNMPVEIRVDSYPFTQFGSIKGQISKIGAESLPPDNFNRLSRYPVFVNLDKKFILRNDQKYKLFPGQSISANVIIRKKRLITIVSDLFGKSIDSLKKIKTKI